MAKKNYIKRILKSFKDNTFLLNNQKLEELARSRNLVLNLITQRQKDVIELVFGLKDGRARTYEEVAQLYGTNRDRIKSIFDTASREIIENYICITTKFLSVDKEIFEDFLDERI